MAIEETSIQEIYLLLINNIKILIFSVREETVYFYKKAELICIPCLSGHIRKPCCTVTERHKESSEQEGVDFLWL